MVSAAAVLLSAVFLCPAFARDTKAAPFRLQDLSWLTGYWARERNDTRIEECWLEPLGGVMVGVHRDLRDTGGVFYEFLRIEERADGIYYVAKPSNQGEAAFRLVALEAGRKAVFENKAHDFPQRIVYLLESDGKLRATIEGVDDDQDIVEVWLMDRAPLGHAP
ncbi:MAG: DUF6265 family protein [Candidatus Krumholzibacteria bacterium]|nr:DUF6265 family protein [Candidatus Krumholzibacteria bacterium]